MNTQDKLKIIKAKIKLAKTKEEIKLRAEARSKAKTEEKLRKTKDKAVDKAVQKFLRTPITYRKILKPSERVGVVLQVAERKPTTIRNFIDASLIRGRSL